jgi:tetratricopeptide (TPR) repeat protein
MKRWAYICVVGAIAIFASDVKAQTPQQAIAFEKQGNLAEATEIWKAVVQRNPQDAAAFAQLGVTLSKQKRFPEAIALEQATYQEELNRLNEEITLAEIEANDARLDQLDVEAAVEFAQYVLLNAARIWSESSPEQKQRLQK